MELALNFIEKLYLSVTKDKNLIKYFFENGVLSPLSADMQEKILDVTFKNPVCKSYAPPLSYQKFFLRILMDAVENFSSECSDGLVEAYAEILASQQEKNKGYCTYKIDNTCIVTLEESSYFVTNGTTGLQTWEASKYLAEWCMRHKCNLENKTILELGSGIGLLGIVVLKSCGCEKYMFSDKSQDVLKVLSSNISINFSNPENYAIEKHQLVWSNVLSEDADKMSPDVILGADIVFDTDTIKGLVHALGKFLAKPSSCAYIASTLRNPQTNEHFLSQLDYLGLKYEKLATFEKSIFIYNPTSIFMLYKIYKF